MKLQSEAYKIIITRFVQWLTDCHYKEPEILEMIDRIEEFFLYLEQNKLSLDRLNETLMHKYYQHKQKSKNLPDIPEQYQPTIIYINSHRQTLKAFSRFIQNEIFKDLITAGN